MISLSRGLASSQSRVTFHPITNVNTPFAIRFMGGGPHNKPLHSKLLHKDAKTKLILRYCDEFFLLGDRPRRPRWLRIDTLIYSDTYRGWTKTKNFLEAFRFKSQDRYLVEEKEYPLTEADKQKRKGVRTETDQKFTKTVHFFRLDHDNPKNEVRRQHLLDMRAKGYPRPKNTGKKEKKRQRVFRQIDGNAKAKAEIVIATGAKKTKTVEEDPEEGRFLYRKTGPKKKPKYSRFKTLKEEFSRRFQRVS